MDNLRKAIKILFEYGDPNEIIIKRKKSFRDNPVFKLDIKRFRSFFSYSFKEYYSNDEIDNLFRVIDTEWTDFKALNTKNIFNVLVYFTYYKNVLDEDNHVPIVRFNNLLRWRDVTYSIGEDILSMAYLAYRDSKSNYDRRVFSWKPILSTNNIRIKNILSKPVAENHFHLKGSAPYYEITWISLMNDVYGRNEAFLELEKELQQEPMLFF